MTLTASRMSARRGTALLILALLLLSLASCLSDEALTAPPVDDPTAAAPFAAADRAALAAALEDARTRLLPGLQGVAASEGLEPAVRRLEAALVARDAAAFADRLPQARAALVALEDGNAANLIELAAVALAIEAAGAAFPAPSTPGDPPSN